MRRHRQQLSDEESISILQKATSGTLALLGDGGYPYAVPISYVYDDGKLYFHSAMSGHKVDAIRSCDKASFCVIDQDCVRPAEYTTYFRSVIAFGRIRIVEDKAEKLAIARILGNRYNPNQEEALQKELEHGLARMLAIRFDIEHLTGKEAIELTKRKSKMMKPLLDVHTHTVASGHGYSTIQEMAQAAADKGLQVLGIWSTAPASQAPADCSISRICSLYPAGCTASGC